MNKISYCVWRLLLPTKDDWIKRILLHVYKYILSMNDDITIEFHISSFLIIHLSPICSWIFVIRSSMSDLAQIGKIWNIFRSDVSIFWFVYWMKSDLKKISYLSHSGRIWPTLGQILRPLRSNCTKGKKTVILLKLFWFIFTLPCLVFN